MSSREILEEDSDDDGLTGAGMDKLVDEGVPHPKHQEELQSEDLHELVQTISLYQSQE